MKSIFTKTKRKFGRVKMENLCVYERDRQIDR